MKILFTIFVIAALAFLFGMMLALLMVSITKEKDKKPSKKRRAYMCEKTREAGCCPKVCQICAWGRSVYED